MFMLTPCSGPRVAQIWGVKKPGSGLYLGKIPDKLSIGPFSPLSLQWALGGFVFD